MTRSEDRIDDLATAVAESMRKHREVDPCLALRRVLNYYSIPLGHQGNGGYRKGSVAHQVLQELQRRSAEARRRRRLREASRRKELLF